MSHRSKSYDSLSIFEGEKLIKATLWLCIVLAPIENLIIFLLRIHCNKMSHQPKYHGLKFFLMRESIEAMLWPCTARTPIEMLIAFCLIIYLNMSHQQNCMVFTARQGDLK